MPKAPPKAPRAAPSSATRRAGFLTARGAGLLAGLMVAACSVPGTGGAPAGPPVSADIAGAQTVSSYFSIYAYGPTLILIDVPGEKAVLKLTFPNESKTLSASGKLVLFDEDASADMIAAWKNNQYSDAIFPDAAQPERTVALGQRLEIVSSQMIGTERPRPDQSYDTYAVTYRVSDIETGRFTLRGFTGETRVHVMMEGKRP